MILSIVSCKKSITENKISEYSKALITKVSTWLDAKTPTDKPLMGKNLAILKHSLNYSKLILTGDGTKRKALVIPIEQEYKKAGKFSHSDILNLVVYLDKDENIQTVQIAIYKPTQDHPVTQLPDNTFYNIHSTANNITDGTYRFLNIFGQRQYDLEYRNQILYASKHYTTDNDLKKDNNSIIRQQKQAMVQECYNYYLVTKIYNLYGQVEDSFREYLFSECYLRDTEAIDYIQYDPYAAAYITYATQSSKMWLIDYIHDSTAVFVRATFKLQGGFIISVSPDGISMSNPPPPGITATRETFHGTFSQDLSETTVECKVKIVNENSSNVPLYISRTRKWTYSQLAN